MRRAALALCLLLLLGGCTLKAAEPGPSYSREGVTSYLVWAVESLDAGAALPALGYAVDSESGTHVTYHTDPHYAGQPRPEIRSVSLRRVPADALADRITAGTVDLAATDDPAAIAAARDAGWQLLPGADGATVLLAPFVLDFDPEKPVPEAIAGARIDWN